MNIGVHLLGSFSQKGRAAESVKRSENCEMRSRFLRRISQAHRIPGAVERSSDAYCTVLVAFWHGFECFLVVCINLGRELSLAPGITGIAKGEKYSMNGKRIPGVRGACYLQ